MGLSAFTVVDEILGFFGPGDLPCEEVGRFVRELGGAFGTGHPSTEPT